MMAANYQHIGGGVNRLGRHYSRFSGFWPMASVVDQSLALRKSQNRESNRRRRVKIKEVGSLRLGDLPAGTERCCPVKGGGNARGRREVDGFLVGDAGDVEEQELFVESLGDFIIAKHLPFENRWSDAAVDSHRNRGGEQVEAHTTH